MSSPRSAVVWAAPRQQTCFDILDVFGQEQVIFSVSPLIFLDDTSQKPRSLDGFTFWIILATSWNQLVSAA